MPLQQIVLPHKIALAQLIAHILQQVSSSETLHGTPTYKINESKTILMKGTKVRPPTFKVCGPHKDLTRALHCTHLGNRYRKLYVQPGSESGHLPSTLYPNTSCLPKHRRLPTHSQGLPGFFIQQFLKVPPLRSPTLTTTLGIFSSGREI